MPPLRSAAWVASPAHAGSGCSGASSAGAAAMCRATDASRHAGSPLSRERSLAQRATKIASKPYAHWSVDLSAVRSRSTTSWRLVSSSITGAWCSGESSPAAAHRSSARNTQAGTPAAQPTLTIGVGDRVMVDRHLAATKPRGSGRHRQAPAGNTAVVAIGKCVIGPVNGGKRANPARISWRTGELSAAVSAT
jgi:hypothetical protein